MNLFLVPPSLSTPGTYLVIHNRQSSLRLSNLTNVFIIIWHLTSIITACLEDFLADQFR